jgi:hypothetical protein
VGRRGYDGGGGWEPFFARNPHSGSCLATTQRLRILERGIEVDGRPWPFIELRKAPTISGSGSQTVRYVKITDAGGYQTDYQLDASGGRAGMADIYDQCKPTLNNAWIHFSNEASLRQHNLSMAIDGYNETVRTSHELDEIAQNFVEAVNADPSLRRLWQAQCRIMELDQAVLQLDFALRYGRGWLERVS